MSDLIDIPPTVVDGTVYAASDFSETVFALNVEEGTEQWRFQASVTSSVTATTELVFVPTYSGIVVLDTTGKRNRSLELGSSFESHSPILAEETLIISGETVASIDVTDWTQNWERQVSEGTYIDAVVSGTSCSPVVSGGVAFAGTAAGDVYAVGS